MYRVNEVFHSIQGEGKRAGSPSIFVRFSGCNMACRIESGEKSPGGFDCDTEFASGQDLTLVCLLRAVREAGSCPWVVLTGGEPGLQIDLRLIEALHGSGYLIAVETNGSFSLPSGIDWITVSPKVAEHAVRQLEATEVKYVRVHGQSIPRPVCKAQYKLISPGAAATGISHRDLSWCIELVKQNPDWSLSYPLHKVWRVR